MHNSRSQKGQLGILLVLALCLIVVMLGALGADTCHIVSDQRQLQAAVDAGALAGAMHLSDKDSSQTLSSARSITGQNFVDSSPVSSGCAGTTVDVSSTAATNSAPGTVTVAATKTVEYSFAPIFGRKSDVVKATATASGVGQITVVPQGCTFPLALSIDAVPKGQTGLPQIPLSQMQVGDLFSIYLGSQNEMNAAFTSFQQGSANANYIAGAIDESLNVTNPTVPTIPAVPIGMSLNLNNGQAGFNYLSGGSAYAAMLSQPFVIFPLIQGSPPYNKSSPVIGFVTLRITSIARVKGVPTIVGIIVKPAIRGVTGATSPGTYQPQVTALSPVGIHLIK